MARQSQMATIDQFMQAGKAPAKASPSPAAAPHAAPGVNAPTPITGGGSPTLNERDQRFIDEENQSGFGLSEEDIAEQRGQTNPFDESGDKTARVLDRILRGTSVKLSNLPDPGGITLPLIILFVFFIFLLPVNGHTRLTWLWLTLTGNASVGQGNSTPASEAGPTAPITNAPATGGSGQPGNPLAPTQTIPPVFTPGGSPGPIGLSRLPTLLATYVEGA